MHILVTGAAGFIGFHLARRLLDEGCQVTGVDNLNDYYSVILKNERLRQLERPGFSFERLDIADAPALRDLFRRNRFDVVVNLAAQAGVRYSLVNPETYISANLTGFANLLECARAHETRNFLFASSSSVYGLNKKMPFSPHDSADHPASLYAATKKANELLAHSYSHLFRLPLTGLRFFTVYGPWGRPDMALFSFAKAILEGRPIQVFNHGRMRRDFTYIDDIINGIMPLIAAPAAPNPRFDACRPDPASSSAPWRIYNIGNNVPVSLERFIDILEEALGKKAIREYLPMQPGDVEETFADIDDLRELGFSPATPLETGIANFCAWYQEWKEALKL